MGKQPALQDGDIFTIAGHYDKETGELQRFRADQKWPIKEDGQYLSMYPFSTKGFIPGSDWQEEEESG